VWAVLLAMAVALLLASCGESEAADTGTSDADTRAYDYGTYAEWDADNDDELDDNEFDESVADTGVYDGWDADGDNTINEDEFNKQTS